MPDKFLKIESKPMYGKTREDVIQTMKSSVEKLEKGNDSCAIFDLAQCLGHLVHIGEGLGCCQSSYVIKEEKE